MRRRPEACTGRLAADTERCTIEHAERRHDCTTRAVIECSRGAIGQRLGSAATTAAVRRSLRDTAGDAR